MKYIVENQPEAFEFHDSEFTLINSSENNLIFSVKHLNIHKDDENNTSEYDLEIEEARITFNGFKGYSFEPGVAWVTDADGNSYIQGEKVVFTGNTAEEKFMQELKKTMTVLSFTKEDSNYIFEGAAVEPFFTMRFSFDSVLVEWDEYKKIAWYESFKRRIPSKLKLSTLDGEKTVDTNIYCHHDENTATLDDLGDLKSIDLCVQYNGKEIWGRGKEYTWEDAFADLQKQLPEDVKIKCCMTCKHGNMCPFGNTPGILYCTKDAVITGKDETLFRCTTVEANERSREVTFVCDDYQEQTDDYFTYNDYLYWLK